MAAYFPTEISEAMAEAFRPSLARSPAPPVPTSSNWAACFLRNQLAPEGYWVFLTCRFLLELIRQQPARKDGAGHRGVLGLSLFAFSSKCLTHTWSRLESLGLGGVHPPLLLPSGSKMLLGCFGREKRRALMELVS